MTQETSWNQSMDEAMDELYEAYGPIKVSLSSYVVVMEMTYAIINVGIAVLIVIYGKLFSG